MTKPQANFDVTLRTMIDLLIPGTSIKAQQIFNDDLTKDTYINYLVDLYHMVVAVCPQMQMAHDALVKRGSDEDLKVAEYLKRHIEEEKDHDLWVIDDLNNLGVDGKQLVLRPAKNEVVNMVGSVYYHLFHQDPVSLLGYLAVGETYPVSPNNIDIILKVPGIDKSCVNTLIQHADIDVEHSAEFYEFIRTVSFTERQQQAILASVKATLFHMMSIASTFEPAQSA